MTRTVTALCASVVLAALSFPGPAAAADDGSAVAAQQQRYVASLTAANRGPGTYSVSADYARVLEYWAQHPDWGMGA